MSVALCSKACNVILMLGIKSHVPEMQTMAASRRRRIAVDQVSISTLLIKFGQRHTRLPERAADTVLNCTQIAQVHSKGRHFVPSKTVPWNGMEWNGMA